MHMSELTEQMNMMQSMFMNQKQPVLGHSHNACPSSQNFPKFLRQANSMNFYSQPHHDDLYNGWGNHPKIFWNNDLNQRQSGTHFQSKGPTLEETLQTFIQATQTQFQNIDSRFKNLEASMTRIGAQLEHVVDILHNSTFTNESEVNANCNYVPIYDSPNSSSKCFVQDIEVEKSLVSNELILEVDDLQQGNANAITESIDDSPEEGEIKENSKLKHVPYFSRYAFIGDDLYPPVIITSSSFAGIEKDESKECHDHIVKLDFVEEMEWFKEKNGFTIYEEEGMNKEIPDEPTTVNHVDKVEALLGFKLFPVVKEPRHRKARAKSKRKGKFV